MTMTRMMMVAIGMAVAIGTPAEAQDVMRFERGVPVDGVQAGIDVIALDPVFMGTAVLNAPYSAEAVTELTQALSDGNRIEQRTSATIARDGHGRTRREQQGIALGAFVAQGGAPIVTITDPASGVHLTLNYDQKVAYRARPPKVRLSDRNAPSSGAVAFGTAGMFEARGAIKMGTVSSLDLPPTGGKPIDPTTFNLPVEAPGAEPPLIAMTPTGAAPLEGAFRRETLEPRVIEGLLAEGIRTTMTIPAGAMGNALPIEIVGERWYSPELQIILMTRRVDPRFGETVYRVVSVDRSEPPAELFKVPSEFRIQDLPGGKPFPD